MSDKKRVFCLFLRHCLSCANVQLEHVGNSVFGDDGSEIQGLNRERIFLIEPFCTKQGIRQAWLAGTQISRFLKEVKERSVPHLPTAQINFASSTLVRAMETAKFVSAGVMSIASETVSSESTIQVVPYISETWGESEEFDDRPDLEDGTSRLEAMKNSEIGSGGTTTPFRIYQNAELLSNHDFFPNMGLPFSFPIDLNEACTYQGATRCALNLRDISSDFKHFRKKVLPHFNPEAVTVVITHGWYLQGVIRDYIIRQPEYDGIKGSVDVFDNLQGMLVSFDLKGSNGKIEKIFSNREIVSDSQHPLISGTRGAEIIENYIRSSKFGFRNCTYCADYLNQPKQICKAGETAFIQTQKSSSSSGQFRALKTLFFSDSEDGVQIIPELVTKKKQSTITSKRSRPTTPKKTKRVETPLRKTPLRKQSKLSTPRKRYPIKRTSYTPRKTSIQKKSPLRRKNKTKK